MYFTISLSHSQPDGLRRRNTQSDHFQGKGFFFRLDPCSCLLSVRMKVMDDKLGRSKQLSVHCHYSDSSSAPPPALCIPSRAGQSQGGAPAGQAGSELYLSTSCSQISDKDFNCNFTDSMEAPVGSFENPIKFRDQDFETLLEECLKSGELFSDETFPAEQRSIRMPEVADPNKTIRWQRPKVDQFS